MFVTTVVGGLEPPELPPGRVIDLPGRGSTFVRELSGPPGAPVVMLLHGWSATADLNWHYCFRALADRFRVIALDHRSHGRGLRHIEPFRLDDCADDVAAVIEQLGVESVIAVGYSMGGPIAQLLWQRHPDVVDGLVLCSTGMAFATTRKLRMLFRVASGLSVTGVSSPVSSVAATTFEMLARGNGSERPNLWGVEQLAQHDWKQVIEAGRQIGRYDARPWIDSVSVPTAVVATLDDDVVPIRHQLDLAYAIGDSTIRRVRGGHHACVTHPRRFVPALFDACREVADRALARRPLVFAAVAG